MVSQAADITRRAKSNLAFALRILPRERRDDAVLFYAYCRSLDDLADAPGLSRQEREDGLRAWHDGLLHGFAAPTSLQREVVEMQQRHQIDPATLAAIADGCLMDLDVRRFETWNDLSGYIWKVACAVGIVSVRLFGCRDLEAADRYAVALGSALQLTNILRDVGEDYANDGRIYLPMEDLARFGYHESDLAAACVDERFRRLMEFQASRAEGYFREAAALLPPTDRRALAPACVMSEIYQTLLSRMRRGGFEVFAHRYRVGTLHKICTLMKHAVVARGVIG